MGLRISSVLLLFTISFTYYTCYKGVVVLRTAYLSCINFLLCPRFFTPYESFRLPFLGAVSCEDFGELRLW